MENIIDRPDPFDGPEIEIPDGLTVIQGIPNSTANIILYDMLAEEHYKGERSHLAIIFDTAFLTYAAMKRGDQSEYEVGLRKILFAIIECATKAGESDYAIDCYLEEEEALR